MTSVGIMASAVSAEDDAILREPFDNLIVWAQAGTATIVTGRTGTAVQLAAIANTVTYTIPTLSRSDVTTVGFAWRRTDSSSSTRDLLRLASDRVTWIPGTGVVNVTRVSSIIASSAAAALTGTTNTWYYIETQLKLHDTLGTAIVRVNGVEILNATGLDTINTVETVYNTLQLSPFTSACTHQYDDLYITTGAGKPFKGDITIP